MAGLVTFRSSAPWRRLTAYVSTRAPCKQVIDVSYWIGCMPVKQCKPNLNFSSPTEQAERHGETYSELAASPVKSHPSTAVLG